MKILCTGGAGYIGSMLVPELLREQFQVVVVDNFMYRQNSLAACCSSPNFQLIDGDSRDMRLMSHLLKLCDAFIPLAALVGAPLCDRDPLTAQTTNADAIRYSMQELSPAQMVLIPISNSGYGIGEPGKECTEESPLKPISLYGQTKVEAEKIAMAHGNSISFRLATVFGMSPRMRLDLLVNDFVYRAVHDQAVVLFEAHFKRNYIHVRDVVEAFVHGLNRFPRMKNQIYNVGLSDANLSKAELCERIQMVVPGFTVLQAPIGKDKDQRDYIVSNAKMEATGWRPHFSIDSGIRELIKGYRGLKNGRYGNI